MIPLPFPRAIMRRRVGVVDEADLARPAVGAAA